MHYSCQTCIVPTAPTLNSAVSINLTSISVSWRVSIIMHEHITTHYIVNSIAYQFNN